jgi:hypothetical protein
MPDGTELPESRPIILVYGHSHTHAVHRAITERLSKQRPVPLTVFRSLNRSNTKNVGNITFEAFLERASQLGPEDILVSMIGGNHHAIASTLQHPQPFDFFTPDAEAPANAGPEIIPYRAIMQGFGKAVLKKEGKQLLRLQQATRARIAHLLPPPPKFDNAYVARHAGKVLAPGGIAPSEVSPPELRLKFWNLQSRVLHKWCGDRGIEVLPPPPEALEQGFLRREYWNPDATHANELYGELVLRLVEKRFLTES